MAAMLILYPLKVTRVGKEFDDLWWSLISALESGSSKTRSSDFNWMFLQYADPGRGGFKADWNILKYNLPSTVFCVFVTMVKSSLLSIGWMFTLWTRSGTYCMHTERRSRFEKKLNRRFVSYERNGVQHLGSPIEAFLTTEHWPKLPWLVRIDLGGGL